MHFQSHVESAAAKKPNGPLRTFGEIADEFGVKVTVLAKAISTGKESPPAAWATYRAKHSSVRTYYELHAMRAWWARYQAQKGF